MVRVEAAALWVFLIFGFMSVIIGWLLWFHPVYALGVGGGRLATYPYRWGFGIPLFVAGLSQLIALALLVSFKRRARKQRAA